MAGSVRRTGPSTRAAAGLSPSAKRSHRDDYFPQQRHDSFGVDVQEAALVRSWRVEHQVIESEIRIEPDLLDVLFRVGRNNPTRSGSLRRQRIGESLHRNGVLDAYFLLCGERQSTPIARILECALSIGVERDFDLDHLVKPRR